MAGGVPGHLPSLEYTVGVAPAIVDTLDAVRRKRHLTNYERAGTASHSEAEEVRELASDLREEVLDWLRREHPELLEEPNGRG